MDYETVIALKDKIKTVVCGLGVGAHFEHWGYDTSKIIEKDWHESITSNDGITIHTAPARHYSRRSFTINKTLWLSFIVQTPNLKVYIGGDSGYDTNFAEIGERFGKFDLAILDNGQYNVAWQATHMLPEEALKATKDLNAKRLLSVHSSKFTIAYHPWDEPLIKITELSKTSNIPLVTPMIGEQVNLRDEKQPFKHVDRYRMKSQRQTATTKNILIYSAGMPACVNVSTSSSCGGLTKCLCTSYFC